MPKKDNKSTATKSPGASKTPKGGAGTDKQAGRGNKSHESKATGKK